MKTIMAGKEFSFTPRYFCYCGTQASEEAAAAMQTTFTNSLMAEGKSVFGNDQSVFNDVVAANQSIEAAGPSQQGFSAAEQNALNSEAITGGANATRDVLASVKAGQAGFGGGNAVSTSGVPLNAQAGVAETMASRTAGALAQIQAANWAQGNQNWRAANAAMTAAPGIFSNMTGYNQTTQQALNANMANAQAADAAANWWVKPVTGLVGGGLNMVTGGLTGANNLFGNQSTSGAAPATNINLGGGGGSTPNVMQMPSAQSWAGNGVPLPQ